MRNLFVLVVTLLIGGNQPIGESKESPAKEPPDQHLKLTFRLLEGDPQGKREAEKLRQFWRLGEETKPDFLLEHIDADEHMKKQTAGTLRVITKAGMTMKVDGGFLTHCGGQVQVTTAKGIQPIPIGWNIYAQVGGVKDGKVRLDLTLSRTRLAEQKEDFHHFCSESTYTFATIKLGEVATLPWRKDASDQQAVLEVSVEECKP